MTSARAACVSKLTSPSRSSPTLSRGKRVLDLAVAIGMLFVLWPLLLTVALLILITSGRPVLFRQERVGWHGRPFTLLKFRTMMPSNEDRALRNIVALELAGGGHEEGGSFKLAHDPRITPLGALMRRTSIDELPQVINVVRGEMSLVGPRPALSWEHELFPSEYRRRVDLPPGITGLWQVSGRSRLTTPEMLRLDLEYVNGRSLGLDLLILIRTLPTVMRGDGAR
jgi:lipopolysaccharide/colanic/teichoic acid biosynthesis glycosyltransferase